MCKRAALAGLRHFGVPIGGVNANRKKPLKVYYRSRGSSRVDSSSQEVSKTVWKRLWFWYSSINIPQCQILDLKILSILEIILIPWCHPILISNTHILLVHSQVQNQWYLFLFVLFLTNLSIIHYWVLPAERCVCVCVCVSVGGRSAPGCHEHVPVELVKQHLHLHRQETWVIFPSRLPPPHYICFPHIVIWDIFLSLRGLVTVWLKYLWDKLLYSQTGIRVCYVIRMEHVQWAELLAKAIRSMLGESECEFRGHRDIEYTHTHKGRPA